MSWMRDYIQVTSYKIWRHLGSWWWCLWLCLGCGTITITYKLQVLIWIWETDSIAVFIGALSDSKRNMWEMVVQQGVNSRVRSERKSKPSIFFAWLFVGFDCVFWCWMWKQRLKSVISIKHIFTFHMKNNESHFK